MLNIPSVVSPAQLALAHNIGLNLSHPAAVLAWKEHALSKYPNEACGFFLTGNRFLPVENISPEPASHFMFKLADYKDIEDQIEGVVHSHTPGPETDDKGNLVKADPTPSVSDMETQIACQWPFAISTCDQTHCADPIWWGDQLPIRPLIGRVFLHGINDCFSLVRDWHRLNGICFDDVPRDVKWWLETNENGEPKHDLYEDLFESRGFQRVQRIAPKKGDCFITKLWSPRVRNHAGVFITDDEFMHHAGDQLSMRRLGVVWKQKLDFLVRHKDLPEDME